MKKQDVIMMNLNYVEYPDSYCHRLAPRIKQLCYLAFEDKCSARQYKELIYNIVQDTVITDKFSWFLEQVRNSDDKMNLYRLCRNSVNKALKTEYPRPISQ